MFRKKNRTKQKSESWLTIPNYSRIIHAQKYQKPSTFCQYFCKPIRDCYKSTATALGCGKLCVGSVAETTTNNRLAWEAKRIERWEPFDRCKSTRKRERDRQERGLKTKRPLWPFRLTSPGGRLVVYWFPGKFIRKVSGILLRCLTLCTALNKELSTF